MTDEPGVVSDIDSQGRRLAAAWRACEGIPTAQLQPGSVKALVEALDVIIHDYAEGSSFMPDYWPAPFKEARTALAPFQEENND